MAGGWASRLVGKKLKRNTHVKILIDGCVPITLMDDGNELFSEINIFPSYRSRWIEIQNIKFVFTRSDVGDWSLRCGPRLCGIVCE